ncbi:magnesium transporter [Lentisphaera profundi]|uniref:Magnesium transporter MgtE n=1 Tax=Lentisphaera profundi TaxID=1658616 RepID=A0ABY7VRU7_9BACT|nr:magnesium transporter [Lentisphaera profundi]WDE96930.1 magnesium transporter [Lentisphaera profundi]
MSNQQIWLEQISNLLKEDDDQQIRKELLAIEPADIEEVISQFSSFEDQLRVFRLTDDTEKRAELLSLLEDDLKLKLTEKADPQEITSLIEEMASDDAADFLADLENDVLVKEILKHTETEFRQDITKLLSFDEESGGGIMTSELCAFPNNLTVKDVLNSLQPETLKDPVMYVYVIDSVSKHFLGAISLIDLIHADSDEKIGEIAEPSSIWASLDEDREKIAAKFRKYNLWVMPVLDHRNQIVGRITVDDILDISIEEADEDIAIMTGTSEAVSHDANLMEAIRLRLPWLVVTLLLALTNAFVIGHFLKSLDKFIVLAAFPTVIAAMGGNTGMQSATVFIRELALEKILPEEFSSLVLRETLSGFLMGIVCGLIAALIAYIGIPILYGETSHLNPFILAKIIFFSVCFGMTSASLIGTLIPISLRKWGLDPAVAAGPFVTTMNDILSSFIYFFIATTLLKVFL